MRPPTVPLAARRAARQCRAGPFSLPSGGYFLSARPKESMGQGGLEPPTPRLSSVCSNQLSYWPLRPTLSKNPCLLRRREGQPDGRKIVSESPQPPTPIRGSAPSGKAHFRAMSDAGISIFRMHQPRGRNLSPQSHSLKGGDPAAGSPTATLLRLHPSH